MSSGFFQRSLIIESAHLVIIIYHFLELKDYLLMLLKPPVKSFPLSAGNVYYVLNALKLLH